MCRAPRLRGAVHHSDFGFSFYWSIFLGVKWIIPSLREFRMIAGSRNWGQRYSILLQQKETRFDSRGSRNLGFEKSEFHHSWWVRIVWKSSLKEGIFFLRYSKSVSCCSLLVVLVWMTLIGHDRALQPQAPALVQLLTTPLEPQGVSTCTSRLHFLEDKETKPSY